MLVALRVDAPGVGCSMKEKLQLMLVFDLVIHSNLLVDGTSDWQWVGQEAVYAGTQDLTLSVCTTHTHTHPLYLSL